MARSKFRCSSPWQRASCGRAGEELTAIVTRRRSRSDAARGVLRTIVTADQRPRAYDQITIETGGWRRSSVGDRDIRGGAGLPLSATTVEQVEECCAVAIRSSSRGDLRAFMSIERQPGVEALPETARLLDCSCAAKAGGQPSGFCMSNGGRQKYGTRLVAPCRRRPVVEGGVDISSPSARRAVTGRPCW